MTINKRAVHSVVQLFISFRGFVHSVFRSCVFTGERSVDRLFVSSIIRPSVRPFGCSFARASVCSFVCVSGLFSCSSACPVLFAIHGHKHVIKNKVKPFKSCMKTLRRSPQFKKQPCNWHLVLFFRSCGHI